MNTIVFGLIFWFFALPAFWCTGSLAGFRLTENNPLFKGILFLGLGLIVFAHILLFTALAGYLKPVVPIAFFLIILLCKWKQIPDFFKWGIDLFDLLKAHGSTFQLICLWTLSGGLILTALVCFFPEIANDALAIQLYLAKLFVRNHSFTPSYFDIASYRPLLMSVLFSSGLLFKNVAISKLLHWVCGVMLVVALMVKVHEDTRSKVLMLFLGLMLFLTPTLINQIATTYIDAGVSLLVFLAYCLTVKENDTLDSARFFYAGLFLGAAVGMRYLALGAYFSIMLILAIRFLLERPKKKIFIAAFIFSVGMLLTSGYWFARAWIYTGNPVYPYLGALFGKEDYALFSKIYFYGMGLPRSIWTFLGLPIDDV